MKSVILVALVALLSAACGGQPFTAEFESVGGEPGSAGAPEPYEPAAGAAGSMRGGAGGAAGSGAAPGGAGGAGASSGGSSAGAAGEAGAPSACSLDAASVTAALPAVLTWKGFSLAEGSVCASCTYEPCATLAASWGTPTRLGDHLVYAPTYTPKVGVPMLVRVAKNDGACSGGNQCELSLTSVSVGLSMWSDGTSWLVDDANVSVTFAANACMDGIGRPDELTIPLAKDLQTEIRSAVIGLKIPCK